MYAKIYFTVWAVFLTIAGFLLVTGNFTPMTSVVFGFIAFGMTFMGMMSVLPSTVGHNAPARKISKPAAAKLGTVVGTASQAIRKVGADLAASSTVEVRKPNFR